MTEADVSVVAPASYGQERIWLAAQLAPEAIYHVWGWIPLPPGTDESALLQALSTLVRRHEALRTRLELRGDVLCQVVLKHVEPELTVRHAPGATREDVILGRATPPGGLPTAPFDVAIAPLWRAAIVRCADGDVALFLAHHAVFDAASHGIVERELTALLADPSAQLEPVSPQPADVATWQRDQATSGALDDGVRYWADQLEGAPGLHRLPLDGTRSESSGQPGDDLFFRLPEGTSERAAALGRSLGATEFMVAFAAYSTLLHRITGDDDIVIGVPVSDRDLTGTEATIGMFVNTVPLRVRLGDDPSFADLIQQVRTLLLGAWEHSAVPLQLVAERVPYERVPGAAPLFQLGFNHLGGTGLGRAFGHAKDELFVELSEDDGRVEFRTDLFEEETAQRLASLYGEVFARAVARPEQRVSQIDLLGGSPKVVASGPSLPRDDRTLVERLGSLAEHGQRTAVRFQDEALSYEEVAAWSGRVASELVRRGCGRGDVVAVEAQRALGLIPTVVGILRAGCAYLPLAPDVPTERRARMVRLAKPRVVLSQHDVGAMRAGPDAQTRPSVGPTDAAYLIFTSGSTGEPKGVLNTHRGLQQRLAWMQDAYQLGPEDVVLHKTPTPFDVSVWELLWPLLHGATIAVMGPETHRDPAEIERECRRADVTMLHFVPSMLASFHAAGATLPPSVRQVVCSGEALPGALVREVLAQHPGLAVDNLYGPTEAAIDVTRYACPAEVGDDVPLGRPAPGTTVHILDRYLRRLPVGVEGDLYLAGEQVARGYLGRPGLTAGRFLPDPFGAPGTVMYATGDRARWSSQGTLTYRGRRDDQVKIRGQRIELEEVSAVLRSVAGVRDAATIVRSSPGGDQELASFVVGDVDRDAALDQLRRALPEVMVPRHITPLDRLPVTTSGKLDRGALATVPESPHEDDRTPEPASGPVEELVQAIFTETLGVEMGGADDFFAHGGNSLTAVRVMTRLRTQTGVELPLSALFESPTVRGLAAVVQRRFEEEITAMSDDQVLAALGGDTP